MPYRRMSLPPRATLRASNWLRTYLVLTYLMLLYVSTRMMASPQIVLDADTYLGRYVGKEKRKVPKYLPPTYLGSGLQIWVGVR